MAAGLTDLHPAGRLGRRSRLLGLVTGLSLLGACTGGAADPTPRPAADGGFPLATPVASLTSGMASTASVLRSVLEPEGFRLELSRRPFRPAEPESLTRVPRAVLQVDVGDPQEGWVVIYELGDPSAAATVGQEFRRYLVSGFGQTNYPLDARFALGQVANTLVFTWWSPERSGQPERAGRAFEILSGVGQPIPVVR